MGKGEKTKHYFVCNYCGTTLIIENGNPCYIGYYVEFRRSPLGNIIGLTVTAKSYCRHCKSIIDRITKKVVWERVDEIDEGFYNKLVGLVSLIDEHNERKLKGYG